MVQTGLIGPVAALGIHVMSLNIRRPMPHARESHPDRWHRRAPLVTELLRAERPTLLGVQEALPEQRAAVLTALGDDYRSIGVGRDARGGDESCPIYWHTGRLELLSWKQSALSNSPDTPGSRSWGAPFARIAVTADFRDLTTALEFRAINTHLDPFSPPSRVRSAAVIRTLVEKGMRPTVVTGDFNSRASSATHRALLDGGLLHDSWTAAHQRVTEEWGTLANYRPPRHGARIDWILATPSVTVTRAAINPTEYLAGHPSDHLPVHAVIEIGERS